MLQEDGGFFVLKAARVQDYPKYHLEKRVGQIWVSIQAYRCRTDSLTQLTFLSQVILQGHRLEGPFWPAQHGPGSFTSYCCILSHVPNQGGREDSLDLKVEDAPCPLWICSKIFGIELCWHCFYSGFFPVIGAPHLNAFSLTACLPSPLLAFPS